MILDVWSAIRTLRPRTRFCPYCRLTVLISRPVRTERPLKGLSGYEYHLTGIRSANLNRYRSGGYAAFSHQCFVNGQIHGVSNQPFRAQVFRVETVVAWSNRPRWKVCAPGTSLSRFKLNVVNLRKSACGSTA